MAKTLPDSLDKLLDGKILAPKVIAYEKDKDFQYLLMSKVPGQMSCDDYFLSHPAELLDILAEALKTFWFVDISDCPRVRDADALLSRARFNIDNNLVDVENVEPTTYGERGARERNFL